MHERVSSATTLSPQSAFFQLIREGSVFPLTYVSEVFFFLTNSVFFKLLKTVRQEIKWSDVFSSPDKNNLIVMSGNQNNVLVLVKTRTLDTYTHTHTHARRLGLLPALIKAAFNTFRAGSDSVGVSRLQTSTSSTWPLVYRQRPVKSSL